MDPRRQEIDNLHQKLNSLLEQHKEQKARQREAESLRQLQRQLKKLDLMKQRKEKAAANGSELSELESLPEERSDVDSALGLGAGGSGTVDAGGDDASAKEDVRTGDVPQSDQAGPAVPETEAGLGSEASLSADVGSVDPVPDLSHAVPAPDNAPPVAGDGVLPPDDVLDVPPPHVPSATTRGPMATPGGSAECVAKCDSETPQADSPGQTGNFFLTQLSNDSQTLPGASGAPLCGTAQERAARAVQDDGAPRDEAVGMRNAAPLDEAAPAVLTDSRPDDGDSTQIALAVSGSPPQERPTAADVECSADVDPSETASAHSASVSPSDRSEDVCGPDPFGAGLEAAASSTALLPSTAPGDLSRSDNSVAAHAPSPDGSLCRLEPSCEASDIAHGCSELLDVPAALLGPAIDAAAAAGHAPPEDPGDMPSATAEPGLSPRLYAGPSSAATKRFEEMLLRLNAAVQDCVVAYGELSSEKSDSTSASLDAETSFSGIHRGLVAFCLMNSG